jgi:hypothetical protein
MAKALNPFAPFWYVPREDKDSPNPSKFKLQGLNGEQMGYIAPEFILDPQSKMIQNLTGKGIETALSFGLLDWENYGNAAGPIAFSHGNFGLMPHGLRGELAFQIIIASHVHPTAQKKLSHRARSGVERRSVQLRPLSVGAPLRRHSTCSVSGLVRSRT